jgi:RHS repeat-associated protein
VRYNDPGQAQPHPRRPRARLVLKLYDAATGGALLHEQQVYLDRRRAVQNASWSWQQLTVGKKADQDCWDWASAAEVYVENLSSQAAWFDDLEIATGALPTAIVVQKTHYEPFGLELAGIGYIADPTLEDKFTYNGKEKVDDMAMNWLDYGARNYDARLGRWWSVDPLAGKFAPLSPYTYVANNPIGLTDPDGRDWSIVITYGRDNTISHVQFSFTGTVRDETGKYSQRELEGFAARIQGSMSNAFKGSGKNNNGKDVTWGINVKITASQKESDVKESDHVFRIVADGEVPETYKGRGHGFAAHGKKYIYLNEKILANGVGLDGKPNENEIDPVTGLTRSGLPTLERTSAHEAGHTAYLLHPENHVNSADPSARITQQQFDDQAGGRNIMYESYLDGAVHPKAGTGTILQQIRVMMYYYGPPGGNEGQLNKPIQKY